MLNYSRLQVGLANPLLGSAAGGTPAVRVKAAGGTPAVRVKAVGGTPAVRARTNCFPKHKATSMKSSVLLSFAMVFAGSYRVHTEEAPPQPVPAPVDRGAQAQRLLEEEALSQTKLREELGAQASAHHESGKRLFSAFDYDEARKELELAVRMDPTNVEARRLLIRVNDILGVRGDRIKSAVAQLYGQHKVAVQEKLVELDKGIDWGKRYMDQAQTDPNLSLTDRIRRYEQALRSFERTRELIKWMPVEVNTDEQSNEATRLIGDAGRAIKAAQARLMEVDREEAISLATEQRESERKFREKKINMLVDHARALYETGKFDSAMDLAEKILELDPINTDAHTIIEVSRDRSHATKRKWLDEEYKEQFTLNRDYADRLNIPHKDYLTYSQNWHEISKRSNQEVHLRSEDGWKQEIRRKLSKPVAFDFAGTPLDEVIKTLNSFTKVNIILDPKLKLKDIHKSLISLKVDNMELETALKWILNSVDLKYVLQNESVFITDTVDLSSTNELVVYDIRDMTAAIQDHPGPRIDLGAATAQGAVDPFNNRQAGASSIQGADLAQLIKDKLLPSEFGDPLTGAQIEEQAGKLLVVARPEVHDKIRALLRDFRAIQTIQVLTQVRFIDVNDGFLESIGVSFTGLDAAPGETGLANAVVDRLAQPSVHGLFPIGGGPGLNVGSSDIQSAPPQQFENFSSTPPFHVDFGPPGQTSRPNPRPILHPRLDPGFPNLESGSAANKIANGAVGARRQWYEKIFGSEVLVQGLTQNLLNLNPLGSFLGTSLAANPGQGAMFQFRFLQSVQANAVLQAVRKDRTQDQLLAPKLLQLNNQRAHVVVIQQQSYIKDYDIAGAVFDPVISTFITGVVLDVKPTVSHDKRYITLDLRPGVSAQIAAPSVVTIRGAVNLPIDLPNLELRAFNSTVTVPDNGTMLFSGLVSDQKFDAKSGVPLLSDLPIVGRLFSTNSKERQRRNLLVLVNARVVLFDDEESHL